MQGRTGSEEKKRGDCPSTGLLLFLQEKMCSSKGWLVATLLTYGSFVVWMALGLYEYLDKTEGHFSILQDEYTDLPDGI